MNITKEIIEVNLKDLKPYPGNPRHNNKSANVVARSIQEFGYINPIVIDEDLEILAGNTRFKALNILGWEKAEVLKVSGLTEKQKKGFVIIDNRAGEYSRWNMAALERMTADTDSIDADYLAEFGIMNIERSKKALESLIL